MRQVQIVEKGRLLLNDSGIYLFQAILPENGRIKAQLDGQDLIVTQKNLEAYGVMERFQEQESGQKKRQEIRILLPESLNGARLLKIFLTDGNRTHFCFQISGQELRRSVGRPQYYLEEERMDRETNTLVVRGWTVAEGHVRVRFFDEQRKPLNVKVQRSSRADVEARYRECAVDPEAGFYAELPGITGRFVYLVLQSRQGRAVKRISVGRTEVLLAKAEKYYTKGVDYLKLNGAGALALKVKKKVLDYHSRPPKYDTWIRKVRPNKEELLKQRAEKLPVEPKISIVVPLYRTPEEYLLQMVESVKEQTYANWELCLSDGSGPDSPLTSLLEQLESKDSRIRTISSEESLHISENTNQAIGIASGDFIAFMDHDDMLSPDALYECVKALSTNPAADVLYSDEDKMSIDGKHYFEPAFKPDYNPDLLRTVNYICHLFVVKRELMEQVGLLRQEYDGAQDYDFILRCIERAKQIHHIPKVLYHWRCHEDSTAENPESKHYAFLAGKRAVEAHYERLGIPAVVSPGEYLGLYRTCYQWEKQPLVSILIPNKDHIEDLRRCITSIETKTTYQNFEYIIIENNSTEEETFRYYKELEARNPRASVVFWEGPFNYSEINNFGASHAKGEYLLLLNNDTEVINGDWLSELLGYCMRQDVGIVGARLYYEDNTIQHAGVVLGFGGIAGHCFVQQPRESTGYCHRIICAQDYSAVTAACMMVDRTVYEQVGGLSPDLAVAFNDIDFCLKVRAAGYLVVYNPYAELYHYESKSRGLEDTPEKRERFAREIAVMEKHWPKAFQTPDPYYNPNLTLKSQDFSLRRLS